MTVAFADGTRSTALTCASCHSRVVDGVVVPGLANETMNLGWGPGRIDVAIPAGEEPVAIPDLRVVALETNLHRDGTVRNNPAALAIRIETLLITAHDGAIRPPRGIRSRSPPGSARSLQRSRPRSRRRRRRAAPRSSPPLAPRVMYRQRSPAHPSRSTSGTNPRVGLSANRGTGGYRVPSLREVATRGRLLHDASVPDLATLLDPSRVGGHRFGLDLTADDRAALLAYLTTL